MKNLTETKALSILSKSGVEVRSKVVIAKDGVNGLSACSALDYLKNYCGYIVRVG